jgi:hypothetical protein
LLLVALLLVLELNVVLVELYRLQLTVLMSILDLEVLGEGMLELKRVASVPVVVLVVGPLYGSEDVVERTMEEDEVLGLGPAVGEITEEGGALGPGPVEDRTRDEGVALGPGPVVDRVTEEGGVGDPEGPVEITIEEGNELGPEGVVEKTADDGNVLGPKDTVDKIIEEGNVLGPTGKEVCVASVLVSPGPGEDEGPE